MLPNEDLDRCTRNCYIAGAVVGLITLILFLIWDFSWLGAIFWGIVIGVIAGFLIYWFMCRPLHEAVSSGGGYPASGESAGRATPAASAAPATATAAAATATTAATMEAAESSATRAEEAAGETVETVAEAAEDVVDDVADEGTDGGVASTGPAVSPSTDLPGQRELEAQKGSWKYEGDAAADASPATSEPTTAAPPPAAAPAAEAAAPGAEDKPELLTAAREGGPDNLKEIKGVGPKLEGLLHTLGVYHFDQIASWSDKEVAWVDANLEGFKGRIARDNWVEQAKLLAAGGQTEFSGKVKKGDVY